MSRLRTSILLLALLLTLTHGQIEVDQEEYNCSHGDLKYLCLNYDVCSEYGLITEDVRQSICGSLLDPNSVGDDSLILSDGSTKTPPIGGVTSYRPDDLSKSRGNDGFTTSRAGNEITTSQEDDNYSYTTGRSSVTFRDSTTDNGVQTGSGNGVQTGSGNGVQTGSGNGVQTGSGNGVQTGSTSISKSVVVTTPFFNLVTGTDYLTTDNRVQTVEQSTITNRHTRDVETITARHTRDTQTVTGTSDNSYTTAATEADDSFSTGTEADDAYTTGTKADNSFTTVTKPADGSDPRVSVTGLGDEDSFTTATTAADFSTEAGTDAPAINGKPPVITGPPVNITVPPGGTARFDCTAMAATTPQITITKQDQTTIPDLDNFIDATGNGFSQTTINSITINNVDYPNEGWYTCQAVNKYGYVRQDAYLRVEDLCIGSTCTGDKTCKGNYDTGVGYTCECPKYCEFDELFKQDYVCSNYCEEWFNECQMKTDACQNDKFAISIMNSGRCGRIEAPEILEAEEEYGVKELIPGEELVMSCHATGFPEPDIKWYRGTTMVGEGNEFSLTVNEGDTGEYVCEAVNCMNTKVNKRLAMVFVNQITTPPAPTTPTEFTTPTAEMDLANNELPDPARSTCAVFGDPHFLTYDQRPYSYMGTCDNVLAMDCEMGRWFVYGRMRPCGKTGGSCLETVTAYVDSEVLELQRGWLVNQNGGKIVPKNHPNKKITVNGRYNNFTLLFDGAVLTLSAVLDRFPSAQNPDQLVEDKLVIKWDGYVSVQIQTPAKTRTCGMCGNNDGNPANDMRMRRRGMTDDPLKFGESWKIDPRKRCKEIQPSKTAEEVCGDRYEETKAECERIFNTEKLQSCKNNQGHDTAPWIESCIYDECEGLMQRDDLPPKCIVAGAYVMRCSNDFWDRDDPIPTRNPHMEGWEEEAQCPDAVERFQPVLDTGCPQPTLEQELAGEFK